MAQADLVLTATKDLRSRVLQESPGALKRTFTLLEFAALTAGAAPSSPKDLVAGAADRRSSAQLNDYDIADPIGASDQMHAHVADVIDQATRAITTAIASAVVEPVEPVSGS